MYEIGISCVYIILILSVTLRLVTVQRTVTTVSVEDK